MIALPRYRVIVWCCSLGAALGSSACRCGASTARAPPVTSPPRTSSPGFAPLMMRGPAVWRVDGRDVHVRATYVIVVGGRAQFTVDYLCQDECTKAFERGSDSEALAIATPVMKYVVEHGMHEERAVRELGGNRLEVELIGVALTQQLPGGRERGYRVARTLSELEGLGR